MNKINILLLVGLLFACTRKEDSTTKKEEGSNTTVKYASGFTIKKEGKSTWVEVTYPFQGATSGYKYLLVPKGEDVPNHDPSTRVLRTPIETIACTSTTHIPFLDYLNETSALVGFTSMEYISSEKMQARIDSGKVVELGIDKGMNLEKLAVLQPDVVMGYTMTADYGQFKKIEELKIPVIINAEYLEKHPLGRAEWIKFMALLFGKEQQADSIFSAIEKNYLKTKSIVDSTTSKPTVVSGVVYGDAWFLPGGENYAARILRDAGCNYLWSDDDSNGWLQLSFESVYDKAHNADLWIGTATYSSLSQIKAADERYARFKAFEKGDVYNYDARIGRKGGNEFLELGYLRPDIILNDLVKIAHPDLLPDHELYFHRKLE